MMFLEIVEDGKNFITQLKKEEKPIVIYGTGLSGKIICFCSKTRGRVK